MNAVAKIEGLVTFGDDIVILVGPDSIPVDFVRAGPALWIGDCITPGCRGLIETDSPEFAAAICDACEDKLDSEALQAPLQARASLERQAAPAKAHSPIPAPENQRSLTPVAPKLVLVDTARPLHQFGHQQCKKCSRFMTVDHASGLIGKVCGTCADEKADAKPRAGCRECGCDMFGTHPSRLWCDGCMRARVATGQRRAVKAAKSRPDKQQGCAVCGAAFKPQGQRGKYCPPCGVEQAAMRQREANARHAAKRKAKLTTNQGDTHAN